MKRPAGDESTITPTSGETAPATREHAGLTQLPGYDLGDRKAHIQAWHLQQMIPRGVARTPSQSPDESA